jgi:hypothetical protein
MMSGRGMAYRNHVHVVGAKSLTNRPILTGPAKDFLGLHASFSPTNRQSFVFHGW